MACSPADLGWLGCWEREMALFLSHLPHQGLQAVTVLRRTGLALTGLPADAVPSVYLYFSQVHTSHVEKLQSY